MTGPGMPKPCPVCGHAKCCHADGPCDALIASPCGCIGSPQDGGERPSGHGEGALRALLAALERKRMLFWTGNVLVECEGAIDVSRHKDDLSGAVTMVLDDEDFAALKALAEHPHQDVER